MNIDNMNLSYTKRRIWIRIREGFISMRYSLYKTIGFAIVTGFLTLYFVKQYVLLTNINANTLEWFNYWTNIILLIPLLEIPLLISYSKPILAWSTLLCFKRAGLTNSVGEPPILLTYKELSGSNVLYKLTSQGISLEDWERRRLEIENAFDITISGFKHGKNMQEVQMLAYKGKYDYGRIIPWDDNYFDPKSSVLALGESMGVTIEMSLDVYPHILIGGGTNSGKTRLLQLLLKQCYEKDYQITIADFKGMVDFPLSWREKVRLIDDKKELIEFLDLLICELQRRKILFAQRMCRDIGDFTKRYPAEMNRIIFACDEVAELLDATGATKEEKDEINKISHRLAQIARLGRAFGIHLFLACQRSSSDVISGQIKNNISYRVCGRADSVLSKIILDNTDASTLIPHDSQGVFLNQDGEIFKAYFFDEDL